MFANFLQKRGGFLFFGGTTTILKVFGHTEVKFFSESVTAFLSLKLSTACTPVRMYPWI